MKSLWAAAAYCLAFFSSSCLASAQVGIYGNFNLTHVGGIASTATTTTSETFYGGGGGVYDEFIHLGPVNAGSTSEETTPSAASITTGIFSAASGSPSSRRSCPFARTFNSRPGPVVRGTPELIPS